MSNFGTDPSKTQTRLETNQYGQPNESIPGAPADSKVPWKFGIEQKLQFKQAKLTRVNLKNFVFISNTSSGTGAIGNGTTLFLNTTLTPNAPRQNDVSFAIPYVAIYQGTAVNGSNQIYPNVGGSITPGAYTVQGAPDYGATNNINSTWSGIITDNSAGNQTIFFITYWRYLQYNSSKQS